MELKPVARGGQRRLSGMAPAKCASVGSARVAAASGVCGSLSRPRGAWGPGTGPRAWAAGWPRRCGRLRQERGHLERRRAPRLSPLLPSGSDSGALRGSPASRALQGLTVWLSNLAGSAVAELKAARGERRTRKMASRFPAASTGELGKAERGGTDPNRGRSRSCFHSSTSLNIRTGRRVISSLTCLFGKGSLAGRAGLQEKRGHFLQAQSRALSTGH